jgi:phosphoglycolate phosphatase
MTSGCLLVLWDVDHTLIENAGVSKAIYAAAFRALTGRFPARTPATGGRTDPAIMTGLFEASGVPEPPWDRVRRALAEAGAEHRGQLRDAGHVLPGALPALAGLARRAGVVQGILTGNIRENAAVKLATFALDRWVDLDVAGYGSDHDLRPKLVAIAQERAQHKHAIPFDSTNTVIVGDTPRDVEAGRIGGARVVAVASGINSEAELREAGAHVVLPSLANTQMVLAAVLR